MGKIEKENSTPLSQSSKKNGRTADQPPKEAIEYLVGMKLFLVMFSITLAAFLMLLDASIVATASPSS
jgi:hypothetical protein